MKEKFKERLKQAYIRVRKRVLEKWTKIPEKSRETLVKKIDSAFNYLQNAFLLAIPVFLFTLFFLDFSFVRYLSIVCIIWIVVPYCEHYYIWLRETWKDDVGK